MTTHLRFIDRFTRTIKNMLLERVHHTKNKWHLLLPNLIKRYKNSTQDSTKFKPSGASKDSNAPDAKTNLVLRGRFKRKYKEINVDDYVRVF